MASFYLSQFEEKFKELIETLSTKFPDKIELNVYKKSLNMLNYNKISKHFSNKLKPYANLITNSDESLFLNDIEFIDQINFSEIWKSDLTENDKKSLWQYIQILYLLSTLIQSNNNLISTKIDSLKKENKKKNTRRYYYTY